MFTLPNLLSFFRVPLALFFLQESPLLRSIAIILALISDGLDGYIARRYKLVSRFGTVLDPLTDKFFVITAGYILLGEGRLNALEACLLVCRDFSLLIFGCYLVLKGRFLQFRFKAIWCGKISTLLQFAALMAVVWGTPLSPLVLSAFILLGVLALFELYLYSEASVPA